MKKLYLIVILIALGITQIYAQTPCIQCTGTTASGDQATSIGTSTTAGGNNSFAGGASSTAEGDNSFVFGFNSTVNGDGSIGLGTQVTTQQDYSIAIGRNLISNAANSYVFGRYLTSTGSNSITLGMGSSGSPLTNTKNSSIMFGVNQFPSLTIVKPDGAALGYVGIGTDDPKEMAHVVGTLLIDRTTDVASSLRFTHPNKKGLDPGEPPLAEAPCFWDIYSDTYGLKFNTIASNGTGTQRMVISQGGSVGIGIDAPKAQLHVNKNILADGNITTLNNFVFAPKHDATAEYWEISRTGTGLNYAYMNQRLQDVLFLGNDGSIGVGTTDPMATLDVDGSFRARNAAFWGLVCAGEVKVQNSCWPDFVFSKDYNLLPLTEVEQFIADNQHLPSIPSAAEVEANGIELGTMNALLLQKVEELTLYIIQMEKRLAELESKKGGE